MNLFGLFGALLTTFVAGFGCLCWLSRREPKTYVAEVIGFSWLFGSFAVSLLLPLGGIVMRGSLLVFGVSLVCLAIGAAVIWKNRGLPQITMWPAHTTKWEKWMCTLLAVPLGWLFVNTFREPLMWDGLFIWEFKARIGFNNGGQIPAAYFVDEVISWTHLSNPLYLPSIELWFYLWFGEPNQYWLKFVFPLFPAAAALLLWSFAVRLSGRVWIGCVTALVLFSIPLVVAGPHGPIHGYADFPLGTFYMAAVVALLIGVKENSNRWFAAAALCAAVLPWIKQEGMFLWLSFVLQSCWVFRKRLGMIWRMVVPGAVVLLGWKLSVVWLQAAEDKVFQPITAGTFVENASRIPLLAQRFAAEFLSLGTWSVLWILAGAAVISLWWRNRSAFIIFLIALVVPLALDFVPYVFTAMHVGWHVENSIKRLVLQLAPVAVAAIGMAFAGEKVNRVPIAAKENAVDGATAVRRDD